ncbi:MAG: hypothetical protein ACXWQO_17980, partial [Bdellovibrionota bacterium]
MRAEFIILLALLAAPIQLRAEQLCLDKKVVARATEDIRLSLEETNKDPLCEPESHTYKVAQTLAAIKTVKFLPKELPAPYNQSILPFGLWKYFSEPTNKIMDAGSHSPNCTDGVIAFVITDFPDGTVYLCPDFYDGDNGLLDRMAAMLHEVRHFSGHPHIDCTRGIFLGDEGGCDHALSEKGAYAVTVESLTKMALLADDFSPLQKEYARAKAIANAENRINEVSASESALYLRSVDKKAYYFDGKNLTRAPYVEGTVISRGENLAVFPAGAGNAFFLNSLTPYLRKDPVEGATAIQFNESPVGNRAEVLDILRGLALSCSVYSRYLSCNVPAVRQDLLVKLNSDIKYAYLPEELGLTGNDTVYVSSGTSQLTKIQLLPNGDSNIGSAFSADAQKFTAIAVLDGKRFGLNKFGSVEVFSNGRWVQFAGPALA